MIHFDLSGTYAQIGQEHDQALGEGGGSTLPPPKPEVLPFVRQCEEILDEFAPELLEEMHALAEAGGVDYGALATISITAPLKQTGFPGYTVFAVAPERTVDDRLIFGRNYDFIYDMPPCVTYRTYPEGRFASLDSCDIWIGREDGLTVVGRWTSRRARV